MFGMPNENNAIGGEEVALLNPTIFSGQESLSSQRCVQLFRLMVRARALEERMIKMSKSGQGYFWIGGPGEEAFNTCLGLQVKKGQGPAFDYLHLHYRNSATVLAMGMELEDPLRQMAMTRTDSFSMGRNFVSHFAYRDWNIIPVTSVIEVQYAIAPGTALVQKRQGGEGITIVVGGEAGSAEGDFASCMIWSTRPGQELPVLMVVMNNGYGISTPACTQHGEGNVIDRGKPFGIPGEVVDGNDPIASWYAIRRAMDYCRRRRRPYLLEARVSRLHGHSSSSGALRVKDEADCIEQFGHKLIEAGVFDSDAPERIYEEARTAVEAALEQVLEEPKPSANDIHLHTYAPSPVDVIYPEDYTGLP
jgi:2-oxoisovalerate dehydrogenase E1 component alpha subunit